MKMKLLYIVLISCAILFSCEKDNKVIIEKIDTPLISKVLVNGVSNYEYTYNDANLISEEKNKFYYIKYYYNDRNLLTMSDYYFDFSLDSTKRIEWVNSGNTEKSLSKVFAYNANEQLIRITYNRPLISSSEYSEFTYENDRISRQTMYSENKISGHIDYFYNDKGNLIKQMKYVLSTGNEELMTTTYYEYDNMQNPYKSFRRVLNPGINTNQNNILKETYAINFAVSPSIEKSQIIISSYDYNDKGYPVSLNGNVKYVYR